MQSLRGDVDDATAFGISPGDLGVLDTEKDEDEQGHQDEDRRARAEMAVEDARDVVDRRADVGKHDRPTQKGSEAPAADLDPPAGRRRGPAHVCELDLSAPRTRATSRCAARSSICMYATAATYISARSICLMAARST